MSNKTDLEKQIIGCVSFAGWYRRHFDMMLDEGLSKCGFAIKQVGSAIGGIKEGEVTAIVDTSEGRKRVTFSVNVETSVEPSKD